MMFSNRILMDFDQKTKFRAKKLGRQDIYGVCCFVLLFVSLFLLMFSIDFADRQVTSGYLKFLIGI